MGSGIMKILVMRQVVQQETAIEKRTKEADALMQLCNTVKEASSALWG